MSQNRSPTPQAAIESLRSTLAMARVLAECGRAIDLGGLDRETATLCARVQALPRQEAELLRPLLLGLLRDVTLLAATLPERG